MSSIKYGHFLAFSKAILSTKILVLSYLQTFYITIRNEYDVWKKKHAFPLMNGNPIRANRPAYKTNQLLEVGRNLKMIMIKKKI